MRIARELIWVGPPVRERASKMACWLARKTALSIFLIATKVAETAVGKSGMVAWQKDRKSVMETIWAARIAPCMDTSRARYHAQRLAK